MTEGNRPVKGLAFDSGVPIPRINSINLRLLAVAGSELDSHDKLVYQATEVFG